MDTIIKQQIKRLNTIITDKLVEDIENGILKPGERLIQNDLAKRFGVSRVAIRDALMELRKRGLSVSVPFKGDIVRPVSYKNVSDIFDLREIVESFAVRLAINNIKDADIEEINNKLLSQLEALKSKDYKFLLQADWDFHWSIYKHCDNETLLEIIQVLWARIKQARSLTNFNTEWGSSWGKKSIKRHKHLFNAIASKDIDIASNIIAENIREAKSELINMLKQTQGWDESDIN